MGEEIGETVVGLKRLKSPVRQQSDEHGQQPTDDAQGVDRRLDRTPQPRPTVAPGKQQRVETLSEDPEEQKIAGHPAQHGPRKAQRPIDVLHLLSRDAASPAAGFPSL